jgi:hypothetical protein
LNYRFAEQLVVKGRCKGMGILITQMTGNVLEEEVAVLISSVSIIRTALFSKITFLLDAISN